MQVLYEIPDLQRASPLGCVVLFTTACFEAKKVFVSVTSGLPVCPFMLSVLGVTGWTPTPRPRSCGFTLRFLLSVES